MRRSGRRRHTSLLSDSACSVLFAKMWNANWDGKYKRSRLDGCRLGMVDYAFSTGYDAPELDARRWPGRQTHRETAGSRRTGLSASFVQLRVPSTYRST